MPNILSHNIYYLLFIHVYDDDIIIMMIIYDD